MTVPLFLSRILPGEIALTPPLVSLIAANLLTIVLAVLGNWDLATVVFIYWAQSVIIGIFAFLSILFADTSAMADRVTETTTLPDGSKQVRKGNPGTFKVIMAGFFALHYGGFHLGYYFFIVGSGIFGPVSLGDSGIALSCGLFFAIHAYSFLYHRKRGKAAVADMVQQFMGPYDRILPMHLTIIFGSILITGLGFFGITTVMPVLVLFLLLKTYADVAGHLKKHLLMPEKLSEVLD
jgi:hypothetical protein